MDLGIRGRKALLSGASRGLGRACALALAQEGVDVIIVARRRDALEKAAAEIRAATGAEVATVAADITTAAGRSAALAACAQPDILLNNADGPLPGDFRDWSRDDALADRNDAAHRRWHDDARLRPHHQYRLAQREDGATGARPFERRALGPRRLCGRAGATDRPPQRHHQQSPAGHLRQRRPAC